MYLIFLYAVRYIRQILDLPSFFILSMILKFL